MPYVTCPSCDHDFYCDHEDDQKDKTPSDNSAPVWEPMSIESLRTLIERLDMGQRELENRKHRG